MQNDKIIERLKELDKKANTPYTTVRGIKEFTCKDGYVDNIHIEGETLINYKIPSPCVWDTTESRFKVVDLNFTMLKFGTTYTLFNLSNKSVEIHLLTPPSDFNTNIICQAKSSLTFNVKDNEQLAVMSGWSTHGWTENDIDEFNKSIVILEGDHTDKPISYFEGLKSIGQDYGIIASTRREDGNLLDISRFISTVNDTGLVDIRKEGIYFTKTSTASVGYFVGYITCKVKPNTQYNFSLTKIGNGASVYIYDTDKGIASSTRGELLASSIQTNKSFTTKSEWITVGLNAISTTTTNSTIGFCNLQLEEGDIATEYKPHKNDRKQIPVILRGLSNGAKDEIFKQDDKYYKVQRCGEYVYRGHENWAASATNTSSSSSKYFVFYLLDMPFYSEITSESSEVSRLCDKFNINSLTGAANDIGEGFFCGLFPSAKYETRIAIDKTKLPTQDVAGFKKWLQANPVTLIYELVTPIITEVPNLNIRTFENKTTFSLDGGFSLCKANFEITNSLSSSLEVIASQVSDLYSMNNNTLPEGWNTKVDAKIVGGPIKQNDAVAVLSSSSDNFLMRDSQQTFDLPTVSTNTISRIAIPYTGDYMAVNVSNRTNFYKLDRSANKWVKLDYSAVGLIAIEGSFTENAIYATTTNTIYKFTFDDTLVIRTQLASVTGMSSRECRISPDNKYVYSNYGDTTDRCAIAYIGGETVKRVFTTTTSGSFARGAFTIDSKMCVIQLGSTTYVYEKGANDDSDWVNLGYASPAYTLYEGTHDPSYMITTTGTKLNLCKITRTTPCFNLITYVDVGITITSVRRHPTKEIYAITAKQSSSLVVSFKFYKRVNETLEFITEFSANVETSYVGDGMFTPDGDKFIYAHSGSPYIIIYDIETETLTTLYDEVLNRFPGSRAFYTGYAVTGGSDRQSITTNVFPKISNATFLEGIQTVQETNLRVNEIIEEQEVQNNDIITALQSNTEIFEMLLVNQPSTLAYNLDSDNSEVDNTPKDYNGIVDAYTTLIEKGLKMIEDVPDIVKSRVESKLNNE